MVTIALPEAEDPRIQEAAKLLRKEDLEIKLIRAEDRSQLQGDGHSEEMIVDSLQNNLKTTERRARELIPLYVGCALVEQGYVDGIVAGATYTTTETLKTCLKVIGAEEYASSCMLMHKPEAEDRLYADCAFNPNPSDEELALIAKSTAETALLLGMKPRVAFISYSTKGSAPDSPSILKVRSAFSQFHAAHPHIPADGELQLDVALNPKKAADKGYDGPIQGNANVLIFPDLDAGNSNYKNSEDGGWQAIGPLLQGLKGPANDLSRGCSVEDIVEVVKITAKQAQKQSGSAYRHMV